MIRDTATVPSARRTSTQLACRIVIDRPGAGAGAATAGGSGAGAGATGAAAAGTTSCGTAGGGSAGVSGASVWTEVVLPAGASRLAVEACPNDSLPCWLSA